MAFQHGADLDQLEDFAQVEPDHQGAPVRHVAHQPFGLQPAQRFADRHARNLEIARERHLVELLAVGELPVLDRDADGIRDVVGAGPALTQCGIDGEPREARGRYAERLFRE